MRYLLIKSMVVEISPFLSRVHDIFSKRTFFAGSYQKELAIKLSIIVLDTCMIPLFTTNEVLFEFMSNI